MTEKEFKEMQNRDELYRLKEELSTYDRLATDITFGLVTVEDCKDEIEKYKSIKKQIEELEGELNT